MKDRKFDKYIYAGVTAILVVAVSLLIGFLFFERQAVQVFLDKLMEILSPIIIGAVLAFLVSPIYNSFYDKTIDILASSPEKREKVKGLARLHGILASLVFLAIIIVSLCYLIIPQLYSSIVSIVNNMSVYVQNISDWIRDIFESNPPIEEAVLNVYSQIVDSLQTWANSRLIPNLEDLGSYNFENIGKIVGGVSGRVISVVNLVKNFFIGIIVMVYLLNIKTTLAAQCKKIAYAFLPLKVANGVVEEFRYIHRVFSGFIIGKIIDSVIIGIICYVAMTFLKLPFVLLISVIVGVTNIIPFFGPFIGAIPSAILVFLISPIQCLYFVGLILVLQQFDGNILGPKILGNSTGLPSFWVLSSILIFGGLFGFTGMILAVPVTAVIFDLFAKLQYYHLRKKGLSPDTRDYKELKKIDEQNKKYIS
ncbi:MAG: AI-2E family transporter [Lachnospiraceae bacterium]|nr:AI-2E family transporter [Lachnospiraceae bacterium]